MDDNGPQTKEEWDAWLQEQGRLSRQRAVVALVLFGALLIIFGLIWRMG